MLIREVPVHLGGAAQWGLQQQDQWHDGDQHDCGIASSVVTSSTDANSALGAISTARDTVNLARAKMGAVINCLQFTAGSRECLGKGAEIAQPHRRHRLFAGHDGTRQAQHHPAGCAADVGPGQPAAANSGPAPAVNATKLNSRQSSGRGQPALLV
jgi:hypothetical protein